MIIFRFQCTNCGHKWTKRSHSTILFHCNRAQRKIECKLFGHVCLRCDNKKIYHTAKYNENDIQDAMEFLREKLLRKLHPQTFRGDGTYQIRSNRRYGPPQINYNVDFADYCESCIKGDYCRRHRRK